MYIVVWQYTVSPENRKEFGAKYGSDGTWARFFSNSEDYLGSELFQSDQDEENYLLIDRWVSRDAYEAFIDRNKHQYEEMSAGFARLYDREEKTGTYKKAGPTLSRPLNV